jgi:glycerophosphoryl diester phosphodiesterase
VIAKGGFSGVFPDSSQDAYSFAKVASAPGTGTAMWCDVQLTKDGVGVCLRDINMNNCTTVGQAYPARKRTYVIDGMHKTGWFVSDFTIAELQSAVYREYSSQYMSLQCKAFRLQLQRWWCYMLVLVLHYGHLKLFALTLILVLFLCLFGQNHFYGHVLFYVLQI